jgi:membrane associated rhomboid family serine protease
MDARRWPLVTLAIMALCSLLLVWQMLQSRELEPQLALVRERAAEIVARYPNLTLPPVLRAAEQSPVGLPGTSAKAASDEQHELEPPPEEVTLEIETLAARAHGIVAEMPEYRFGFWAKGAWWGLLTYAFLHAGIAHFLGNAWFLWLSGATLEDRWGRGIFSGFYLAGAAAAGIAHRAFTSAPNAPLIGASGAVAAAMGAFMVIHGTAKIRFAYVLWVSLRPRWGTFQAPAYGMLLLWLVLELLWALLDMDSTAHWAHIGGFAFGAIFAYGLKRSGWDQRLDASIEAETASWQDPRVLTAATLASENRHAEAFALLDQVAAELPASIDVQLEMLRLAQEAKVHTREISAYDKLIGNYLSDGMFDAAGSLIGEVRQRGLELELDRGRRFGFAEVFARHGQRDQAARLYEGVLSADLDDELAIRAAVAFATLASRTGRHDEARAFLERASASSHKTLELAQRIEAQLDVLRSLSAGP